MFWKFTKFLEIYKKKNFTQIYEIFKKLTSLHSPNYKTIDQIINSMTFFLVKYIVQEIQVS